MKNLNTGHESPFDREAAERLRGGKARVCFLMRNGQRTNTAENIEILRLKLTSATSVQSVEKHRCNDYGRTPLTSRLD